MAKTLPCPGCKAELVLPALPTGQAVQCPRCQQVFEPGFLPAAAAPSKPFQDTSCTTAAGIDDLGNELLPEARYRPLHGEWKAPTALLCLALSTLCYGLQLYVNFERAQLIQLQARLFEPPAFLRAERLPRADARKQEIVAFERRGVNFHQRLTGPAEILHHVTGWPAAFFFLIWLHQAAWNLRSLQASGIVFSPWSVVLSFFITVLNLFRPYLAMQEIWRASDPRVIHGSRSWRQAPGGIVVIAWWSAVLAAGITALGGNWMCHDPGFGVDDADRLRGAWLWCASNFAMMIAGATLIGVVRGIQQRQRARHTRIYEDPA